MSRPMPAFLQLLLDWRNYTFLDWILMGALTIAIASVIGGLIAFFFTEYW